MFTLLSVQYYDHRSELGAERTTFGGHRTNYQNKNNNNVRWPAPHNRI